jgi:hypothetical protein
VLYEIINLSDQYTIEAPDLTIAGVACLLLGDGQYAFKPFDDSPEVPVFAFGGVDSWFQQYCGAPSAAVVAEVRAKRAEELATALDSVLVGGRSSRERYALAIQYVPAEKRVEFRDKWHDLGRSSTNDIGHRAYAMAAQLRTGKPRTVPRAPGQVLKGDA